MVRRMVAGLVLLAMGSMAWAETITVKASLSADMVNADVNAADDTTYFAFRPGGTYGLTFRGLLKFPAIPEIAGKVIESAVLNMNYCYADGANPNLPLTVSVFALEQDWDVTTTWATQPALLAGVAGAGTGLPVGSYGWYTWNVQAAVQAWADGLGNTSLEVRGDEGIVQANPGWQVIKFIFQANQAGNEPYLTITYHKAPNVTLKASASGTLNNYDVNAPVDTTYYLLAGYSDGITRRSLLKFPASPAIAGKTIDSAVLHLNYCWSDGAISTLPLTVRLFMLASDWDATTSWASLPAVHPGSGDQGQVSALWLPGSPSGWNTLDVTEAVQAWAGGLGNTSLAITGDELFVVDNPGWHVIKFFNSSSHSGNEPWIEIYFTIPGDANKDGKVDVSDLAFWPPITA